MVDGSELGEDEATSGRREVFVTFLFSLLCLCYCLSGRRGGCEVVVGYSYSRGRVFLSVRVTKRKKNGIFWQTHLSTLVFSYSYLVSNL